MENGTGAGVAMPIDAFPSSPSTYRLHHLQALAQPEGCRDLADGKSEIKDRRAEVAVAIRVFDYHWRAPTVVRHITRDCQEQDTTK